MPKLELGDLEGVARLKEKNIPVLARYAREGFAILTAIPSCTLMFKQELPLMFPADGDVKAVQEAMFDPFEYLVARHRDGLLKTDFTRPLGKVSYHVPCHGRVQKIGRKTEEILKLIGIGLSTADIAKRLGRSVKTVEWHRVSLGDKLGVTNRVELARIAIAAGLVSLDEPGKKPEVATAN
jgi:DNA-binding CsgD family transcriptional regulator